MLLQLQKKAAKRKMFVKTKVITRKRAQGDKMMMVNGKSQKEAGQRKTTQ
jgi:hypothetical protein